MIGDKQSDIDAGLNARCRFSVQVLTGAGQEEIANRSPHARSPDYIAEDLFVAARWLIENWG
jgi:phosphoglycolate phosphatase-like HAD superfamily hydrolase